MYSTVLPRFVALGKVVGDGARCLASFRGETVSFVARIVFGKTIDLDRKLHRFLPDQQVFEGAESSSSHLLTSLNDVGIIEAIHRIGTEIRFWPLGSSAPLPLCSSAPLLLRPIR